MARSDLLISLVKASTSGDQTLLRKTVEAIVAEERSKNHEVLADRLSQYLTPSHQSSLSNGINGHKVINGHDLSFEKTPHKKLSDLVLPNEVLELVTELIEEQQRSQLLRTHGLEPRHRILLSGEPGNGKTSLAEAIAYELALPFVVARYDSLIGSYLGETASRLRKLFDYVRTKACVLFFDEFDTLGKERGDTQETGEIKRVVSSLLMQIDDLPSYVVVITATNHQELLDRAVWRRFQLKCNLPKPNTSEIEQYLKRTDDNLKLCLDLSSKSVVEKLKGASFSELEGFAADISRRFVLAMPEPNLKKILTSRLAHWQKRLQPNNKRSSK
jgi:SpoVK/Ycf46/Vps4 family AAA+-type ATPase